MPVFSSPGSYKPSGVPGNVCNMFLLDRVLCCVSYMCNFGLKHSQVRTVLVYDQKLPNCPVFFIAVFSLPSWYSAAHVRFGVSCRAGEPQGGFYFSRMGEGAGRGGGLEVERGFRAILGK